MLRLCSAPHGGTICHAAASATWLFGTPHYGRRYAFPAAINRQVECCSLEGIPHCVQVELPEVESGSYTRAHTDFVHTLSPETRTVRTEVSTAHLHHSVFLSRETRQWPERTLRFHEERRTPRPYRAGYGPCPRHCKECFCRLLVRCFI